MEAQEAIRRMCELQTEVWEKINNGEAADCFCGEKGFWGAEGYGGTFAEGYRNDGSAIRFIEDAVREKLSKM